MSVFLLTEHWPDEQTVIGIYAKRRRALKDMIECQRVEWQEIFDQSRIYGKRERFEDEGVVTFGLWWDERIRQSMSRMCVSERELIA